MLCVCLMATRALVCAECVCVCVYVCVTIEKCPILCVCVQVVRERECAFGSLAIC
jgi:hypothetical protein